MKDRRHPGRAPLFREDRGLFRMPSQTLVVILTPQRHRNRRGDWIFDGYVLDGRMELVAVEAAVAGRRTAHVGPLIDHLDRTAAQLRAEASAQGRIVPKPSAMRIPIEARGCWRNRFAEDVDGIHEKFVQFVLAQWTIFDRARRGQVFGTPPAHETGPPVDDPVLPQAADPPARADR